MNLVASKKFALSECLRNIGPLKDKVVELIGFEESAIRSTTADAVHLADVDELNKHILQKKALERVLQLMDELKEELHPGSTDEEDLE